MKIRTSMTMPAPVDDERAMTRGSIAGRVSLRAPERLLLDRLATPIGEAWLVTDDSGHLRALDWPEHEPRMRRLLERHHGGEITLEPGPAPAEVVEALTAYFEGELTRLDAIICATGGTPLQRAVWAALRRIPAGHTLTYGALATRLGHPKAVRAVGRANGANPIGIVIPCHRVIGADGALTGYSGGLERKRWLLAHEGVRLGGGASASQHSR